MKGENMAFLGIDQSYSSGGSVNAAESSSWSSTDAAAARAWSEQQATVAFERQRQLMQEQQAYNSAEAALARQFNAEEAEKSRNFSSIEAKTTRDWQQEMADSVYTRSVKNMIEAGINPILAANMGLSGAAVGSGATASTSQASGSAATGSMGSAPLAQNFMDAASGSQSTSKGTSWNSSESGLATGLAALGASLGAALSAVNNGMNLQIDLGNLGQSSKKVGEYIQNITLDNVKGALNRFLDSPGTYTGNAGGQSKGYFNGSSKHIDKNLDL